MGVAATALPPRGLTDDLLSRTAIVFIAVRYGTAVAVASEALIFAWLLGPASYGRYALITQLATFLVFVAPGAVSGYFYAYFTVKDPQLNQYYVPGAMVQFLLGLLCAASLLWLYDGYYLLAVVVFLFYVPYYITEPMLRVKSQFSLPAFGRALPSAVTLALLAGWWGWHDGFGPLRVDLDAAVALMTCGTLLGLGGYYVVLWRKKYVDVSPRTVAAGVLEAATYSRYWRHVLRPGIPLNVSTLIVLAFSFTDRLFIERFRAAEALSVYTLAWQLCQGALLILTSLNLVSSVRVGECMKSEPARLIEELRRRFFLSVAAGAFTLCALVAGTIILRMTIYREYEQLVTILVLLSAGYVWYNIVGSVTGVLQFSGRARALNIGYAAAFVATVAGNVLALHYGLWFGFAVGFSSLVLIVLNCWFTFYVWHVGRGISMGAIRVHGSDAPLVTA